MFDRRELEKGMGSAKGGCGAMQGLLGAALRF